MLRGAPPTPEELVNQESPEFDPSPEGDEGPEVSSGPVSRLTLVIAITVMLLPAGIPVYFALNLDGSAAIWFFALAGAIAIVNILLVFGIWSWLNTQRTD